MDNRHLARGGPAALLSTNWGVLLAAFASAYGTGLLALIALPFMVGANMQFLGIDESQAGLLSTIEFAGVFVTSVLLAPKVAVIDRRKVAIAGAAIVILANLASAAFGTYGSLLVLRAIAGLGAGLALAVGNATVANAEQPEKFAGHMTVLFVFVMAIITKLFGPIGETQGQTGIYLALAGTVTLLAPLLLLLPPSAPSQDFVAAHRGDRGHFSIFEVGGVAILVAFFCFSLRDTISWAFIASTGIKAGLSEAEVGGLLANSALFGLAGPLLATLIGARFGLRLPLVAGILVSGLVTYLVSQSSANAGLYAIAVQFWVGSYFFCLAYLTALAAEMDIEGRVAAAAGSALMVGLFVGPSLGGRLIADGSYVLVGHVNNALILGTLVGAFLAYRSLRGLSARRGLAATGG